MVRTHQKLVEQKYQVVPEPTEKSLRIYPNPAANKLHIQLTKGQESSAEIRIYNVNGKQLLHLRQQLTFAPISIDISSLVPGVYFVEIANYKGFK